MRGIFISYRRDDTAGYAGRLYDALTAHFGRNLVFMDIDSIRPGQNFVDVIVQRIASCSVVIVLIGKAWLNSAGNRGRRLDDPLDFLRIEVVSAFRRNIPVIPVLVGGAKMPRPNDLPDPLAPLAHLNAIEIFDQLFSDSVRHLVSALRPFVYPKPRFWPSFRSVPGHLRPLVLAIPLLATLGIAGMIWSLKPRPDHNGSQDVAPLPSETLFGPDESVSPFPRVKILTPRDITELPPIIEASRNVTLPGSSLHETGPAKPRISWRANVTVGDAWDVLGIASDGTAYLYDWEHEVLDAVRDGQEQWAYKWAYRPPSPFGFAPDGRLWLGDYCFNSRGEGGRVTRESLLPDRTTLRLAGRRQNTYDCREGKVYAMDSRSRSIKAWIIDLDGNCGAQSPTIAPRTGNVYASSDALTVYALTRDGQLLWTVKQACRKSNVNVYPLSDDDLIVACSNQPLYSLRAGKTLWTATIGDSEGWYWSDIIFDGSGNLYVGAQGPSAVFELAALDKSGKQIWTVPAGRTTKPIPVGFDTQGRLYVSVDSERIVSLSH